MSKNSIQMSSDILNSSTILHDNPSRGRSSLHRQHLKLCSALNGCADQIPEIRELETEGLCDVRQGDCSTVQVFGQGFRNSHQLKCEFVKEKVL